MDPMKSWGESCRNNSRHYTYRRRLIAPRELLTLVFSYFDSPRSALLEGAATPSARIEEKSILLDREVRQRTADQQEHVEFSLHRVKPVRSF
jgi:hypothetical protein